MNNLKLSGAILATSLTVLALTSCGDQQEDSTKVTSTANSAAASQNPTDAPDDADHEPPFGPAVACTDLLAQGWTAPETEPNITFDSESGLAEVTFTEPEDTIIVDLASDPACAKLPDIGQLLARTRSNHDQALREYCEDLVATLNAGETPENDGVTADPEAMRSYVRTDCPEDVAKELR